MVVLPNSSAKNDGADADVPDVIKEQFHCGVIRSYAADELEHWHATLTLEDTTSLTKGVAPIVG